MHPILNFTDLTAHLQQLGRRFRLSIVCGSDDSTAGAAMRAVNMALPKPFSLAIAMLCAVSLCAEYQGNHVSFVEADTHESAAQQAVMLVREGKADVLMKGLLHTETLLRAVLNKEWGILPKGRVLTHIAVAQIPAYHKLLFFTDAAVIPYPTHEQRVAQVAYLADMLHAFGIQRPRISLIHCAETVNDKFRTRWATAKFANVRLRANGANSCRWSARPPHLVRPRRPSAQGIQSPLEGDADAVVVPDIEVGNVLYKSLPLFAGAQMAGTLQGTLAPVVLPSRGDDLEAKFIRWHWLPWLLTRPKGPSNGCEEC